ncbi:MAG: hypothetical protein EBT78_18695, partial [Betaproteobacteria bacterium]|nr:hypothetical protein [Betaproteobacteria bacterium]
MNLIQFARGYLGYYALPSHRDKWGGPFNGQEGRCRIFAELINKAGITAIVETGSYKGVSTDYMHRQTDLPIYSVENHARYYGYTHARLGGRRNVHLYFEDCRSFLRHISPELLGTGNTVLFYLDAHWHTDLPLADELQIVFSQMGSALVMIDDFAVPGDIGYGYDDYGPNKQLTVEYIASSVRQFDLQAFFPALTSQEETGSKRGCVVLAKTPSMVLALEQCVSLWGFRDG